MVSRELQAPQQFGHYDELNSSLQVLKRCLTAIFSCNTKLYTIYNCPKTPSLWTFSISFSATWFKNMACFRFCLPFKKKGRYIGETRVVSNNVNEEYMEAFRTNSFIEMSSKIQSEWGRKSMDKPSSSHSLPTDLHFSRALLYHSQSTLTEILLKCPHDEIRHFLAMFFRITSEACKIFESILHGIHQTRASYSAMGKALEQLKQISDDEQREKLCGCLASLALLRDPLATVGKVQFQDVHDKLYLSLQRFTSRGKKIKRRRKLVRRFKRIAGGTLVATCCALAIALLILMIHSTVGIMVLPGLAAGSLGSFLKQIKKAKRALVTSTYLKRFEAQLDTAAKGIYLLMNDIDTMSRLMIRLHDEIEHSKFIATLYLRRRSIEMLKEVARDFRINKDEVVNQLEELEDHVYLCILSINRSRRMLTQEMVES